MGQRPRGTGEKTQKNAGRSCRSGSYQRNVWVNDPEVKRTPARRVWNERIFSLGRGARMPRGREILLRCRRPIQAAAASSTPLYKGLARSRQQHHSSVGGAVGHFLEDVTSNAGKGRPARASQAPIYAEFCIPYPQPKQYSLDPLYGAAATLRIVILENISPRHLKCSANGLISLHSLSKLQVLSNQSGWDGLPGNRMEITLYYLCLQKKCSTLPARPFGKGLPACAWGLHYWGSLRFAFWTRTKTYRSRSMARSPRRGGASGGSHPGGRTRRAAPGRPTRGDQPPEDSTRGSAGTGSRKSRACLCKVWNLIFATVSCIINLNNYHKM